MNRSISNNKRRITMYVATAVAVLILAGPLASEGRGSFELWDDAQFTVNSYQNSGMLYDESCATIVSGGSVDYIRASGTSTVNVSGGSVLSLDAYYSSTVNVSAGSVSFVDAYHSSTVDISAGSVSRIDAYDESSTVNISGGSVGSVIAHDASTVDISGGSVGSVIAHDASTVDISGGSVSSLYAYDDSAVDIHGYDFRTTAGLTLDGDNVLGTGVLTGKWYGQDDTMWAMTISTNAAAATIRVVPEPATLSLLALGGLVLVRRRRRGGLN